MNIRQVRKKIKSIGNVKKITKAMEMVSAIKMKKAQQKAVEGKPYQDNLDYVINKVMRGVDADYSKLLQNNLSAGRDLVIIISSNKGLCGGFNFNIFRYLTENKIIFSQTDFISVGKKGSYFVSKMKGKVLADFSANIPLNSVSAVFNLALTNFLSGQYRKISIVYSRFISALRNTPVMETLLPFSFKEDKSLTETKTDRATNYLVEPDPKAIIDSLIKSYLEEKIRFAIIQNEAGEHSSRMIAMKNASDNAEDLTYNLTMLRNQLRQTKITSELLDMVTAKELVETT